MASKTSTQTTRMSGRRVRIVTRVSSTGTKVTVTDAPPEEWELQAAQVRALRAMPEYGKEFLLAGDMNAERRGPKARFKAVATGMTAGEPDLRIYVTGGRLLLIENKVGKGRLTPEQVKRHEDLRRLGFTVEVLRAVSTTDAASQAVALVRVWLSTVTGEKLASAA
ncbi:MULTISPECIES: VRR-NUC domain-containing protein [unclassified Rhizobium]|uniref:VRR-NUC domain-containing protein n=1 Tax=unclassified Rhizobium TaxID=2613769 RepID=UPI001ADC9AE5|nr:MULTISPECIES: VRR-NUC domain-containing protein [unclassified Rhizobium]MBO9124865.1 VRR-NUC domain-containing protein [Rhizobium sp. 16-488-2b]MBO9175449.1 VRR-NUC domain-containing protein [Rhizobium sp. 16-488-2a]